MIYMTGKLIIVCDGCSERIEWTEVRNEIPLNQVQWTMNTDLRNQGWFMSIAEQQCPTCMEDERKSYI